MHDSAYVLPLLHLHGLLPHAPHSPASRRFRTLSVAMLMLYILSLLLIRAALLRYRFRQQRNQLLHAPNVIGQPCFHRWRHAD